MLEFISTRIHGAWLDLHRWHPCNDLQINPKEF